jgi:hypothetical protein
MQEIIPVNSYIRNDVRSLVFFFARLNYIPRLFIKINYIPRLFIKINYIPRLFIKINYIPRLFIKINSNINYVRSFISKLRKGKVVP